MKIAIVGAGFVGQATGRGLSKHKKNTVVFIDVDQKKVDQLRAEGFEAYTPQEYPEITTSVTMFCVPTPTEAGRLDSRPIKEAISDFSNRLKKHKEYHVVVIRSTVTPGTTRTLIKPAIEAVSGKKAGKQFGLVTQPEYLREVTANEDFERPWLILYGAIDDRSAQVIEKIYKPFDAPIERVDSLDEAEMQKYIHNTFNAVKIAFYNEMRLALKGKGWDADKIFLATAQSCEGMWNPIYGIRDYGPFDGACLPKDTQALLHWGEANGYDFSILKSVINQNLKHERLLGKNEQVSVSHLAKIGVKVH